MPSVTTRSKIRDIGLLELFRRRRRAPVLYIARQGVLSFRNLPGVPAFLCFGALLRWESGIFRNFADREMSRRDRVFVAIMFSNDPKGECGQDEGKGPLLVRGENENLPPLLLPRLHSGSRRRTWTDRYLCRMFSS